jgi:hypothetical protein
MDGIDRFRKRGVGGIAAMGVEESEASSRPLDELHLADLIRLAMKHGVINEACAMQAGLAKDARNLIHPGKALRSGEACDKTTALTALTAVYRVINELRGMA